MKRTLKEEIERIHSITYGKKIVLREDFIDKILDTIGVESDEKKIDEPGKADLVEPDVADFYKTLQDAAQSGGLSQQKKGQMNYQKTVESMQIGLLLLGYKLPRYGVDGLFGPETGRAVNHFKNDNGLVNQSLSESALVQLNSTSHSNVKFDSDSTQYDSVSSDLLNDIQKAAVTSDVIVTITTAKSGHGTYAKGTTNVSRHMSGAAVDISIINGKKVISNREDTNKFVGALKSMGYVVNQESGNSKAVLTYGFPGHDNHVHVSNTGGIPKVDVTNSTVSATPEMLNKMITLLQQKNIKAEQIKQYIDRVDSTDESKFTKLDLTTDVGLNLYSKISQKFIDIHKPNPLGITGDMMAQGAKSAYDRFHKYVPPELALSQLLYEGGIGNPDPNVRPVRTKNPFNVGNTVDGKTTNHLSVQDGINAYYNLIAKDYMGTGKSASELVNNFVNHQGNRYAAVNYEKGLNKIIPQIYNISRTVVPQT